MWLGCPLAPPAPVSHTHGALARRDQDWRRWNAFMCYLVSLHLPCPAVRLVEPLAPSRSPYPLCGWLWCSHRCPGWLRCFRPLPSPIRSSPALRRPQGSLWRFRPLRATPQIRGCQCPPATEPPLSLPVNPLLGFPPLWRPQGCPLLLSLRRALRPGFPAVRKPSPFPFFLPHGGPLLPLHPRPRRWHPMWRFCQPLLTCTVFRSTYLRFSCRCRHHHFDLPCPPAVSASSSDVKSSVSSLLHLALLDPLSSVPLPPTRYFPPVTLSCVFTGRSSFVLPLLLSAVVVVSVASVVPIATPALTRFSPLASLFLPPSPLSPPLPSLRFFRPPAPPRAPPPPAPVVNIAHKDKYVGYRTGEGEALWPTVGGSAPCGKCPNRLLAMVGGGINHPLFLHRPQQ